MHTLVVLLLFIGMFFVVNGIYEQKLEAVKSEKKIEFKYVPRTYYEEQVNDQDFYDKMANMFNKSAPWKNGTDI